jgi:phosphatidate phosphatase APP1
MGWRVEGGWTVELRGCVYEPESRHVTLAVLRRILGLDDDTLTPAENSLFKDRARLFLVDHQDDRVLKLRVAGKEITVGPTRDNGHFLNQMALPASANPTLRPGQILSVEPLVGRRSLAGHGIIHLVGETGLSVISDIDDTIKVTEVRNRQETARNTFCRPFQPVDGMGTLYKNWATQKQAQFHYLSGSPWQLCLPLQDFLRDQGFPAGTFHLRHCRLKDRSGLEFLNAPDQHKAAVLRELMERFDRRQFVLVGDSGEKDPEVYGAVARAFPGRVTRILIRDVTSEDRHTPRYQSAFQGLATDQWVIFTQAAELTALELR